MLTTVVFYTTGSVVAVVVTVVVGVVVGVVVVIVGTASVVVVVVGFKAFYSSLIASVMPMTAKRSSPLVRVDLIFVIPRRAHFKRPVFLPSLPLSLLV